MANSLQSWIQENKFQDFRLSRRRLLQLLGYSTAGIVSLDMLAACGGTAPPPVSVTATPSVMVTSSLDTTRQLTPYFVGYNDEAIHSLSWKDTNFAKATAQLKPGTIRYPGGTIANYWDWKKGWFFPNITRSGLLSIPPKIYRLQGLQLALQATGAIPIYVLNMLTSDLDYQLEMLRTAKSMGLPVTLVEMGNEFYLDQSDNMAKFPTGQDYGKATTSWISAIRSEFPDVQIAAVGGLPEAGAQNDRGRRINWTQDVLQTLQGADALTLHTYVDIKQNLVSKDISTTGPEALASAEKILGALPKKWQEVQDPLKVMPSKMQVWFTEYNLTDQVGNVHHRWIQGIFVASMVFTFLEENRSALSCIYDMICGHGGFEAIACNNSSQGYPGDSIALTPFALTAVGWSTSLMSDTMSEMNSAQQISFNPNPVVNDAAGSYSYPSLMGWAFSDGSRRQALILNRSANTFAWKALSALPRGSQFKQLSSDPLKIITGPDSFTVASETLQDQLLLPPYSLTQIKSGNS